ncbi:MAG TPA: hypothetical protein VFA26_24875 [Gemmataceae bacterium]|nr:hypothetical protein [Gemmataceae bacterium]
MYRRRRRTREIHFSFDSFLDLVANVVGIIIRLILIVWVGARSYTGPVKLKPNRPPPAVAANVKPIEDPLQEELQRQKAELARAQSQLLEQLRQVGEFQEAEGKSDAELAALESRRQRLLQEKAAASEAAARRGQAGRAAALSLAELRQRSQKLSEEIKALAQMPAKKVLRYQTPVSRPVQSEELIFECRAGRITFLDVRALVAEIKEQVQDRREEIRQRGGAAFTVGPVGAFRMRYFLELQRGFAGDVINDGWVAEPIADPRGETIEQAMAPGSEFRQIVDRLDPQLSVVTFCVYPDSFATYRQVRDYLSQRDVVVAGRPLPFGAPIAAGRGGTVSRGQ